MKIKWLIFTSFILPFYLYSIQTFGQEKTKVLFVGSYHMAGTQDRIKVESDDILGAKRQTEIKEILKKLKKFKPSKIFVENTPEIQIYWDSIYLDLKKGILPKEDYLIKNEIFQLGLQLANMLNLEKGCICVDWQMPDSTRNAPEDKMLFSFYKNIINYYLNMPKMEEADLYNENFFTFSKESEDFNSIIPTIPLKDVLLKINSKEYRQNSYYLGNTSIIDKNINNLGPICSMQATLRNLNIYKNIIQATEKTDKNIMIIYGSAHGHQLVDLLQTNPRFEIVELKTVLK